jgi:hypothetical protein
MEGAGHRCSGRVIASGKTPTPTSHPERSQGGVCEAAIAIHLSKWMPMARQKAVPNSTTIPKRTRITALFFFKFSVARFHGDACNRGGGLSVLDTCAPWARATTKRDNATTSENADAKDILVPIPSLVVAAAAISLQLPIEAASSLLRLWHPLFYAPFLLSSSA